MACFTVAFTGLLWTGVLDRLIFFASGYSFVGRGGALPIAVGMVLLILFLSFAYGRPLERADRGNAMNLSDPAPSIWWVPALAFVGLILVLLLAWSTAPVE